MEEKAEFCVVLSWSFFLFFYRWSEPGAVLPVDLNEICLIFAVGRIQSLNQTPSAKHKSLYLKPLDADPPERSQTWTQTHNATVPVAHFHVSVKRPYVCKCRNASVHISKDLHHLWTRSVSFCSGLTVLVVNKYIKLYCTVILVAVTCQYWDVSCWEPCGTCTVSKVGSLEPWLKTECNRAEWPWPLTC